MEKINDKILCTELVAPKVKGLTMNLPTNQEISNIIDGLYQNGKTPSQAFGMDWEVLEKIEKADPEFTCKNQLTGSKRA